VYSLLNKELLVQSLLNVIIFQLLQYLTEHCSAKVLWYKL